MKRKYILLILLFIFVCLITAGMGKLFEKENKVPTYGVRPFPFSEGYLLGPLVVAVVKCKSYELNEVKSAVDEAVKLIGGLEGIIKPGDVVGIKPNLTGNVPAELGVTTHPNIVLALVDSIRKITSGEIIIMEGSGGCNTWDAFRDLGLGPTDMDRIEIRLGKGIKKLEDLVIKYRPPLTKQYMHDFKLDRIEKIIPERRTK